MTNERFDARPDNAYNTTFSNNNLSLQALELMAQSQPPGTKGEARTPDFLNCDDSPFQKGCEGPGKNPLDPPKDNESKKPEGPKEDLGSKWPPFDSAWGTPHGQGLKGQEGREGREGKGEAQPSQELADKLRQALEGREGKGGRVEGGQAIGRGLQEHNARTHGPENTILPSVEIIEDRSGRADTRPPHRQGVYNPFY